MTPRLQCHLTPSPQRGAYRQRQSGQGVLLVLVMILLLVLAIIALGHSLFTSSVTKMARMAGNGDIAIDLLDQALSEAHYIVARSVNDSSAGDFYETFRNEVDTFSFEIPLSDLTSLSQTLDELRNFELADECVKVQMIEQNPASKARPSEYDRVGRLCFMATVTDTKMGVSRTMHRSFDVKVLLGTQPRPLDCRSIFIADASPLVTVPAKANKTIEKVFKRLEVLQGVLETVKGEFEKLLEKAKDGDAGSSTEAVLQQAIDLCANVQASWPTIALGTGDTSNSPDKLHLFPENSFAVSSDETQIELGDVCLPNLVRSRLSTIDEAEASQGEAYLSFSNNFSSLAKDNPSELINLLNTWCTALTSCLSSYEALLVDDYKAFQDSFKELDTSEFAVYETPLNSLKKRDLLYRSTAIVYDYDAHGNSDTRTIGKKFTDLLERGPACSGQLFVVNKDTELEIDHTFRGRLTIVVYGDCLVKELLIDDNNTDLVTLVCFGRLTIEGTVNAAVIAAGSLKMEDESALTGNLTVIEPDFDSIPAKFVFNGKLVRDERQVSGSEEADGTIATVNTSRQYVTIAPVPIQMEAWRK